MKSFLKHSTFFFIMFLLILSAASSADENQELPALTPPVLIFEPESNYPEKAREEEISARVLLEIDIDETGKVEDVRLLKEASPEGYGFNEAAINAAQLFLFEPALEGNVAIPVTITYEYIFVADIKEKEIKKQETQLEKKLEKEETKETIASEEPKVLNFQGFLRERGTRIPLPGITVTVFKEDEESTIGFENISDSNGQFKFYSLSPGQWWVLAQADGYYPLRTKEDIEENQLTTVSYFVEKSQYNPYDVLVEGSAVKREVSKTTLDVAEVERVPGTFGDILTVVQNLPGVARTGPAAGNIVIRGSSAQDSLITVDGVNVPIIYHFGGLRSVLPLGMLESLDFYPGNFSSRFGRATGGVIDIRLKNLQPARPGGYVDINLADSGIYLETPLGPKSALAVGARRSYIDTLINAFAPDNSSVNLVTAPRYYDYQILSTFRPNKNNEFKAFFFGSDDRLEVLFDNPAQISPDLTSTDASTKISFYRFLLQHKYFSEKGFSNELKLSSGRNKIFLGVGDQAFLDLNTYVAQISDIISIPINSKNTIIAGIDYLFTKADAQIKLPSLSKEGEVMGKPNLETISFTESDGSTTHSTGVFVELESRLTDQWLIIPGVRVDHFSRVSTSSLAPRLNTRFDLNPQWTIKGGVGAYHREPFFDETDPVFGNPDLGLEKAIHYSLGFEYSPLDHLTVDITGFYKDMHDLVSRTSETTQRNGQTVPLNYVNEGKGRVYGMEVLIKHDFANNFTGWLSYTLSRALRKDYGSDEWRKFDFDQTHILTLLGTYSLPKNWSLGFRWRLVSGSPVTLREGATYNVDDASYEPYFGKPNAKRLPPFHQLDLRVDKRWIFNNWMFGAYLDIQNVYNSSNETGYTYNFDSTQKRPSQGLPVLPIFGIKGEF